MTQNEKNEALRVLNEKQLQLQATMTASDAHASKCIKLGINFEQSYPDDYAIYTKAREQYNVNEEEIARIEAIVPEDEPHEQLA